jgi:lactoylglutathione lyase
MMVNDIEECIKFYSEIIGLPLCRRTQPTPGVEIAFMGDDGNMQLELIHNEVLKEINIGQDLSLAFEVESVNEKMEEFQKMGIPIYGGPYRPSPYVKFFYILDPNGLKVQLVQRFFDT